MGIIQYHCRGVIWGTLSEGSKHSEMMQKRDAVAIGGGISNDRWAENETNGRKPSVFETAPQSGRTEDDGG